MPSPVREGEGVPCEANAPMIKAPKYCIVTVVVLVRVPVTVVVVVVQFNAYAYVFHVNDGAMTHNWLAGALSIKATSGTLMVAVVTPGRKL